MHINITASGASGGEKRDALEKMGQPILLESYVYTISLIEFNLVYCVDIPETDHEIFFLFLYAKMILCK